jgi:hypothetical protein
MSIRAFDQAVRTNLYNPLKDYEYLREKLLEVLLLVGYSEDDVDSITIDEIVNSIRETYPYIRVDNTNDFNTESELVLKEMSILLVMNIRRIWFRYNLAKVALENG